LLANKLSKVSFMIKSLNEILSFYKIQNVYFTKFQALLWSGIQFCGGIGGELNTRILRIQKRVSGSMVGVSSRTSCRQLYSNIGFFIYFGSDLFHKKILSVSTVKFYGS